MEQEIARRSGEFMLNLTGQEGTIIDCLPEPTGWLVRVEVRESEEQTEEGRVAWVSVYELHLDPLLAVAGCQRRTVRREPLPAAAPVPPAEGSEVPAPVPPEPESAAERKTLAPVPPEPVGLAPERAEAPTPMPPGPRPRAPRPVSGPPEPRRVSIVYRTGGPGEG
ncbi:MAG: hypothetical protein RDU89_01745 [bacterium]|nr:hypothetical protein [bacterium]